MQSKTAHYYHSKIIYVVVAGYPIDLMCNKLLHTLFKFLQSEVILEDKIPALIETASGGVQDIVDKDH